MGHNELMEENATRFYIKETHDRWDYAPDETLEAHLESNKFYVDGWFKKKVFNCILWILKKLKIKTSIVTASAQTMVMKSFRIDRYDIEQLLVHHKIDIDYIWEQKPRYLVVGQDVFQKLTGSPLMSINTVEREIPIQRNVEYGDSFDDFYGNRPRQEIETMFWGFKVIMVPWINGCFLLPEVN